jgi:hypothetical protein
MPITIPSTEIELSKSTLKTRNILETRAADFRKLEAAYQQDAEKYRSMSLDDSPKNFTEIGDTLRQRRIDLLVSELSILTDVADLFPAMEADQQAAANAASDHLEKVRADVLKGLLALGYVEGLIPGANRICITPGMIQVNPQVFEAQMKCDSITATSFRDRQRVNWDRIEEIQKQLERCRAAALSGV